jgi:hypothetical protein
MDQQAPRCHGEIHVDPPAPLALRKSKWAAIVHYRVFGAKLKEARATSAVGIKEGAYQGKTGPVYAATG